jgi:hypothetical protein
VPHHNRVTPFSTFEAVAARGTLMGNRGILHDERGRLGAARWRHPHWVTCLLEFKSRWRPVMQPHAYTELFFLDEATAFAAGHRPCGECRRPDYLRFLDAWAKATGKPDRSSLRAVAIDEVMHESRQVRRPGLGSRDQRTWRADLAALPHGSFIRLANDPHAWVVAGSKILRWNHTGYDAAKACPRIEVEVLTPKVSVAAFRAGYRPMLHSSAQGWSGPGLKPG